jgi:hypothetical protein
VKKLFAMIAIEAPLVALIVFSSFGPSEWPMFLFPYAAAFPYLVATVVIAPIMVVVTDRLFRRRP